MAFQLPINYNDPTDFTFDTSKSLIDENGLTLIVADIAESWNEPFDSDTGFTYDPLKVEFDSGEVKQTIQVVESTRLLSSLTSSVDAEANRDGSLTGLVTGGAIIVGSQLDCTGQTDKGVSYDNTITTAGALRFDYTTDYTGAPTANVDMCSFYKDTISNADEIEIFNAIIGNSIRVTIRDSFGVIHASAVTIATFNFVAGEHHEIEFNFDSTTGDLSIYVDGVGSFVNVGAWTRSTGLGRVSVGAMTPGVYNIADASFDSVLVFDAIQHTSATYPAPIPFPTSLFVESKVDLPVVTYTGLENVSSFNSIAMTGTALIIINGKYWNSVAWVVSDGSILQANTLLDVNTNIGSLTPSDSMAVSIVFSDNNVGEVVSDLTFNYTGRAFLQDVPVYLNGLVGITELASMAEVVELNGGGSHRVLILNGAPLWYNGVAWVTSNITFAESNTVTEITANAATLPITTSVLFSYITILNPTATTSPLLKIDWIEFCYSVPQTFEPSKTIVYGHLREISGFPVNATDMQILVKNKSNFFTEGVMIVPSISIAELYEAEFIYDFAWSLYESETAQQPYEFTGTYKENGKSYSFTIGNAIVPKTGQINLADLF